MQIVISSDPKFHWGRPVWYGKMWVMHFISIQWFTYCAMSAPAELLVKLIQTAACGCQLRWSELLMQSKWCRAERHLLVMSALIRRQVTKHVNHVRWASANSACKLPLNCPTWMQLQPLSTIKSLLGGYANSATTTTRQNTSYGSLSDNWEHSCFKVR